MTAERDALAARIDAALRPLVIYESTDGTTTRKVLADDALRLQSVLRECRAALAAQPDEPPCTWPECGCPQQGPCPKLVSAAQPTAAPATHDNDDNAFLRGYNRGLQHAAERAAAPNPTAAPATDDLVRHDLVRHLRSAIGYPPFVNGKAADLIERQARERSDMSVDIEKYRNEIAELKSERDAAQRAGVTTANYWMERAELAEDQRERTRDVWATRAERAEAERDALRDALREITRHAAPIYATSADESVRKGYEVGGYIKWYTIPPHIFNAARAKVGKP